jgi:pilus assembly protein CpaB
MQNRRALIFFAFAILFGVAAAFTAHRALERQVAQAPAPAPIETVDVMIARSDIQTGGVLDPQLLTSVEWPKEYAPPGAFFSADDLTGRVLRHALAAGEPVLEGALLPEGSAGGLVSVISENTRAVSVKVDQTIGVAGFVAPGTRVDVLATLRELDTKLKLPHSKVVLQDVRVLAIDQKMETASNGEPELVSVVTLEVEPEDSEKLIYASHEGQLQLALRSPADHEIAKTKGVTVRDIIARRSTKRSRRAPTIEVVKGSEVSLKSY